MSNEIELLAPAGDWDSFLAAVENGADAIYLGGRLFNARQSASNFDIEQLKRALDYAHVRDVSIYLAMNTLMNDGELKEAVDFAGQAYLAGIDGIIVQDLGFAKLARHFYPDLNLHASTQMTIYNLEGVGILEKLGFKRVVLARELSADEIEHIAKNTPLEIEVFVHGALCVSYSGQCLMSSIIGGRSGNRGRCAQPCRLRYELTGGAAGSSRGGHAAGHGNKEGYLLSPKDLCLVQDIDRLLDTGVTSLKIEGRMKTPEYVATVVRIYRKYLDAALARRRDKAGAGGASGRMTAAADRKDMRDLTQIFNRGGFTTGYFHGKSGRDMMSYEKPKNWGVRLGKVLAFDRAAGLVKLKLEEELSAGDGIEVWNGENESPGTIVSEIRVNGKSSGSASAGDIVSIGRLKGKIAEGNMVYKTSDKSLNMRARDTFTGKFTRKVWLDGNIILKKGSRPVFSVWDEHGNKARAESEVIPEAAVSRPLTRERVADQLGKTGATPFEFGNIGIELDEGLSMPVSEINNLRRGALEDIEDRRKVKYERQDKGWADIDAESLNVCSDDMDTGNQYKTEKEKDNAKISVPSTKL